MKNQPLHTGAVIGAYRLLHLAGFGPASCVYLAEREGAPDQQVVFKLFDAEPVLEPHQQYFLEETRQISRLQHPSLLPFLSAGIYGEVPYVARAYVKRGSLHDYLAYIAPRPLPSDRALRVLQQIGEGLLFAHQHQIVHANLKPENILLLDQEHVVLTDFRLHSLAKVIRTARLRTARAACYMAPEQFQGIVTPLSDQYAFACVAYELLTGHPPFTAADFRTQAYKHMVEPPLPPGLQNAHLPRFLDQVLLKALEKWPDDRYIDMQALLSALTRRSSTASFPAVQKNAHAPLAPESGKLAVAPALALPPTKQASEPRITEKSRAVPSPARQPFPGRVRLVNPATRVSLLKLSETAVLAALVFLFDRLKKCKEFLSLLKLFFSVLKEKRQPMALAIRTRVADLWEKSGASLSRIGAAPRRIRSISRMRRKWLLRRSRLARALPHAAPPTSSPSSSGPARPTEHFWTRRKVLFAGGAGATSASVG